MEDNPSDQPARTDQPSSNQQRVNTNDQHPPSPAQGPSSRRTRVSHRTTSSDGRPFITAPSSPTLDPGAAELDPTQSSASSSQISGAIPVSTVPIARRTRSALRASVGGTVDGIETASSASAGSRALDHPQSNIDPDLSGGDIPTRSRLKRTRLGALFQDKEKSSIKLATRAASKRKLSNKAKGKQRQRSASSSSLSDIDLPSFSSDFERENQDPDLPPVPDPDAELPSRKRSRPNGQTNKTSSSTATGASREEEIGKEEGSSSVTIKRRMSGKSKAKAPAVSTKKQPKPPKRERGANGSGSGRRNKGSSENDMSLEEEDVDMDDFEPVKTRSRKSSNRQGAAGQTSTAALTTAAASSSSSAISPPPIAAQVHADEDSGDEEAAAEVDAKPSAAFLAALDAATGLAGPSAGGGGTSSAAAAAAAALADAGGSARSFLHALGGMGGIYGYGIGGGGGTATKWKTMLSNLKSPDAQIRLAALEQASMELAMSMEEMLAGRFPTEAAVKEFVAILNRKPNIEKAPAAEVSVSPIDQEEAEDWIDEDAELRAALAMSRGDGGTDSMDAMDSEIEVQADLHACRCLVNLMEALPGSTNVIVQAGAVPALCSKLQSISFIELAAQVINTLEKIAVEQPAAIVRAGGMQSLLNFIDFFDKYDQRSAVTAVASCCRRISPDNFNHVKDVFPKLREVLGASEPKLVEAACSAIIRTIESYRHKPELLDQLIDKDTIAALNILILPSGGGQSLPPAIYTELLKALSTAAKASVTVTMACIDADLPGTIYYVLTGVSPPKIVQIEGGVSAPPPSDAVVQQNIAQRPKGQVEEALTLLTELLPPAPKEGVFDPRNYTERMLGKYVKAKSKVEREKAKHPDGPGLNMEDLVQGSSHATPAPTPVPGQTADAAMAEALGISVEQLSAYAKARKEADLSYSAKTTMFKENLESVSRLIMIVLPVLVSVYSAASAASVRIRVLSGLSRAIAFSDAELLRTSLKMVPLAGLLSAIITSNEPDNITLGMLQITELLLDKVPDIYARSFTREGIFEGICSLSNQALSPAQVARTKEALERRGAKADERSSASPSGTPSPESSQEADIAAKVVRPSSSNADTAASPAEAADALDAPAPTIMASDDRGERKPTAAALSASDKAASIAAARKAYSIPMDARDANILRAKVLRIKMALDDIASSATEKSDTVHVVKRLIESLADVSASGETIEKTLDAIADLFSGIEEPISSYELLHTGLLDGLYAFVTDERDVFTARDRQGLLYERFTKPRLGRASTPFTEMVSRLQESLSRLEQFEVELPVMSVRAPGSRVTGESPLDNLIRHMRVRVIADVESDMPRHYKDMVVTVAAVTPVSQIQGYLRARSTGAGSSAALGGRGGLAGSFYESYLGGADALRERVRAAEERLATAEARLATATTSSASRLSQLIEPEAEAALHADARSTPAAGSSSERRSSARIRGKAAADPVESASKPPVQEKVLEAGPAVIDETEVIVGEGVLREEDDRLLNEYDDDHEDEYGDDLDDDGGPMYEDDIMDDDDEDRPVDRTVVLSLPEGKDGKAQAFTPDGTRVATPTGSGPTLETSSATEELSAKTGSYAAAVRAQPQDWHFEFTINGQTIKNGETMYGAITRTQAAKPTKISIWDSQPTMRYKRVPGPPPVTAADDSPFAVSEFASLDNLSNLVLKESSTATVLQMLRVLHTLNEDLEHTRTDHDHVSIDQNAFINQKLTAKFIRQLEELVVVLSGTLPKWAVELPRMFPFLFPFEARFNYLQTTAFGYSRIVHKAIAAAPPSNSDQRRNALADLAPRHTRVKVRLARENILFSATRVMELYAPQPGTLEIEYFEEIGTGLGPTLEFYTLVSRAFAGKELGIWRDEDGFGDGEFVQNRRGLFPSPTSEVAHDGPQDASPAARFTTLGLFAGKALLDSRIIDLNFNKVFMKVVLGVPITADIDTLRLVDPALAQSLEKLQAFITAKSGQDDVSNPEPLVAGTKIEELGLDFTLPGYPEVQLKPGGAQIDVDVDNVEEYIALVLEHTLIRGVAKQVEAFKQGFSKIFSVAHLRVFAPSELVLLFGDPDEDWSKDTLEKTIKVDHGYTSESQQVRDLIQVMTEFSREERRAFLQFTTGAPKLPIGGFKGLSPPFTVVRRQPDPPYTADNYLPSVMTCVAYFKLPGYSTREVLRAQVVTAMQDGAGAFWLS